MSEFFTVDRAGKLNLGDEINIDHDYDAKNFFPVKDIFTKDNLKTLVGELFPNGLAEHGKNYLLDQNIIIQDNLGNKTIYVPNNPMIEIIFELVRRLEFPTKPSRFQSVFGWETYEQAENFKKNLCQGRGAILKIAGENYHKFDMNLLFLGGSTIGSLMFSRKYWRGEQGVNPNWEILLKPPVRVIEVIENY